MLNHSRDKRDHLDFRPLTHETVLPADHTPEEVKLSPFGTAPDAFLAEPEEVAPVLSMHEEGFAGDEERYLHPVGLPEEAHLYHVGLGEEHRGPVLRRDSGEG